MQQLPPSSQSLFQLPPSARDHHRQQQQQAQQQAQMEQERRRQRQTSFTSAMESVDTMDTNDEEDADEDMRELERYQLQSSSSSSSASSAFAAVSAPAASLPAMTPPVAMSNRPPQDALALPSLQVRFAQSALDFSTLFIQAMQTGPLAFSHTQQQQLLAQGQPMMTSFTIGPLLR